MYSFFLILSYFTSSNFSLVYIMTEDSLDEQFAEDLLVQYTLRKCTAMAEDGSLTSCVSDEEFYQVRKNRVLTQK